MKIEEKDMYKVKRFKIKDDYRSEYETIGILVENNNVEDFLANPLYAYNYKILDMDGDEIQVRENDIQKISAVKNIDKNIREMLNQYGLKRKQIDKKISKIKNEFIGLSENKEKEEKELLKSIVEERKMLFPEEFDRGIYEKIKKLIGNEYSLYTSGSYMDNSVHIGISKDIEKYAKPENYSFIYEEYDRTLHIDSDMPSYKKFKEKYDKNFNILSSKELKKLEKQFGCIIEQHSNLSIGDKDWLSYNFYIYIRFDEEFLLNDDYVNKVVSIVSKFL